MLFIVGLAVVMVWISAVGTMVYGAGWIKGFQKGLRQSRDWHLEFLELVEPEGNAEEHPLDTQAIAECDELNRIYGLPEAPGASSQTLPEARRGNQQNWGK